MTCVLVIENQQLLGAAIEILLRRDVDLQVVGATPENEGALLQAVRCSHADVIVLDEFTTDSTRLLTLLEHHPGLRIVIVSADDGLVRMYEARQVIVKKANELVALIKS